MWEVLDIFSYFFLLYFQIVYREQILLEKINTLE